MRRVSNWVRKTLGEKLSSIRQNDQELERVTTPSLRALQLYSQADSICKQSNWRVAEQLLRQALIEDPEFASAHILLAWTLRNLRRPEEEWKPHSDSALELSERASERERYFIQGSYFSMRSQQDKAIPIYEALNSATLTISGVITTYSQLILSSGNPGRPLITSYSAQS